MSCSPADVGRRLSIGACPLEGESLPGFIMRVADLARFRNSDLLAGMAGLRQPGSAVTDADLRPLATLIGVDASCLAAIAYRPVLRRAHHDFGGGVVNREFLLLDRRRACPGCLEERVFHRARWDLAMATACPEHGVRLIDRCPACRRKLAWRFTGIAMCTCGYDLRLAPAQAAGASEADANGKLSELAGPGTPRWMPQPLQGCDRADLMRAMMCLGMFMTGWARQRRVEKLVAAGPASTATVLCAGMEALEDWPISLHRFLERQGSGAGGRRGVYGARKTMGAFYDWLTLMEKGSVKDALASAAADHVARSPELRRRTHRSRLLATDGPGSVIGLNEAAGALGVSGEGVRRLMSAGTLPETPSRGRGVPILIDRAAVERLAATLGGTMDLARTAAYLGISKARVRRLAEGGTIVRLESPGPAKWLFRTEDVDALLARLSPAVPGDGSLRTVGFEAAAEALRRRGVGLIRVLELMGNGQLPAVGLDLSAAGLKRFRFHAAGVRSMCRELEAGGTLTVQAAAERLGLKWQVVANLVARRILHAGDGGIDVAELDRFAAGHVYGGVLARESGTSPRALALRLAATGVHPVVGPNVDGSLQNIYRRKDIGG